MSTQIVSTRADLNDLYRHAGLNHILLHTNHFKYRGLMPLALKRSLYALREGGRLEIVDDGFSSTNSPPFEVPFNLIRQWTFKLLGRDTKLIKIDLKASTIVLERTRRVTAPGWSAGVTFSGSDREIPTLQTCLDGLLDQPELRAENGGEIVVCGPTRDIDFLDDYPSVRYLVYNPQPLPRFMICEKKNFLAAALNNPRMVLLHSRITLQPGALASTPAEFDIGTPGVLVEEHGELRPYLSLCYVDGPLPGQLPRRAPRNVRNVRDADPFEIYRRGPCYIDGGTIMVMKSVFEDCPLDANLAWEEGEDVEWCIRAAASGYLVEMFPDSLAVSQTHKLTHRPRLPEFLLEHVVAAVNACRLLWAWLRHTGATMMGWR